MMRRVRPATQPIYPDFEGHYTSMPCDGPSCWEGLYCLFLKRFGRSEAVERLEQLERLERLERPELP
jgi:hypothetical protein